MRKKLFCKNFSRSRKARLAMYRSLARALVLSGKINTTLEKAKVLKVYFEKQLTVARRGTVAARRKLYSNLGNAREVVDEIVRYAGVTGYLKVIPLPSRRGDAAKMARIEMVGWTVKPSSTKPPKGDVPATEGQGKKVKKVIEKKKAEGEKAKKVKK